MKFGLLMENWNTFLSEGRESKALYQAMVDSAPDGKWWKLKPSHPDRKAYRAYLDSKGGFGRHTSTSQDEEEWDEEWDEEDWDEEGTSTACPEGWTGPDCDDEVEEPKPSPYWKATEGRGWEQRWFTGHAYKDIDDDCRKSICSAFAAPSYLW